MFPQAYLSGKYTTVQLNILKSLLGHCGWKIMTSPTFCNSRSGVALGWASVSNQNLPVQNIHARASIHQVYRSFLKITSHKLKAAFAKETCSISTCIILKNKPIFTIDIPIKSAKKAKMPQYIYVAAQIRDLASESRSEF